jgi:hypothetical protein
MGGPCEPLTESMPRSRLPERAQSLGEPNGGWLVKWLEKRHRALVVVGAVRSDTLNGSLVGQFAP